MSLSKVMLRGYGLNDEQVQAIIDGHMETVTGLQGEVEKYKTACDTAEKKLAKAQKELDDAKEAAQKDEGKNPYKVKYDAIKEEFESFKKDIKSKETKAAKEDAFKSLLKEVGVAEKRIGAVIKVSDIESIELDENGKIKNADELKKSVKEEWSDFIPTEGAQGASTSTPPKNNGGSSMTKEQIRSISDPVARQKAMAENPALFGLA